MIDLDKITCNVAADLCRRAAPSPKNVETLVRDAFRRGLQLGLSLRTPSKLSPPASHDPVPPPPARMR